MKDQILSVLPRDLPWQNTLYCYDTLPSTNDLAKTMAADGAKEGTVILAKSQTAGRGRLGRHFYAPADMGVYLSVILRPNCSPAQLMHLTCAAAVAACDGVETATAHRPKIKWTNDLILSDRKLGGILTELSINPKTGLVDWAVVGIGINCNHREQDFPDEIRDIATSLLLQTQKTIPPSYVAGNLICALWEMNKRLLLEKNSILSQYRKDCMTLNRQVLLVQGDTKRYGTAVDIDEDGALEVIFEDGVISKVNSGEISVRGLYGYA